MEMRAILPVVGRAKRNKNKLWPAKAIYEENDTQYLIEYEPVYRGADPEIYIFAALEKVIDSLTNHR